jgi:DNA-binding transcriptional ArsR family regulator
MSRFTYQKWQKQESERRIINALSDGNRSYGELLIMTNLSKPVLSERLKSLEEKGKIESVPERKNKRFLYHLKNEKLDNRENVLVFLHKISNYRLDILEKCARDSSVTDKEYVGKLEESFWALFHFRLLEAMLDPTPAREEWMRNVLGSEFVNRIPKLIPNNRNIMSFLLDGISQEEQTLLKSKNAKEATKQFIESIKKGLSKTE